MTRSVKLAGLPLGVAGRATLGLGKRLGGRPAEAVAAELQARTAEQLRPDMELLDALANDALAASRTDGGMSVDVLASLAPSLRTRVLRAAALEAGAPAGELFHDHVVAMDELVTAWRGQRWVDLPGHLRAVRHDGALRWERADRRPPG